MPTTLKECLEKFDEQYPLVEIEDTLPGKLKRSLASFLSSVWSSAYKAGQEDERKTLKKNIAIMRQWLNEDRISSPEEMVTNEDLESWLLTAERPIK